MRVNGVLEDVFTGSKDGESKPLATIEHELSDKGIKQLGGFLAASFVVGLIVGLIKKQK